jgi:hypothetical protein
MTDQTDQIARRMRHYLKDAYRDYLAAEAMLDDARTRNAPTVLDLLGPETALAKADTALDMARRMLRTLDEAGEILDLDVQQEVGWDKAW